VLWYAVEGGCGRGGGDGGEEENAEDRRDPKVRLPTFMPMSTLGFFFLIDIPKMGGQWSEYHS